MYKACTKLALTDYLSNSTLFKLYLILSDHLTDHLLYWLHSSTEMSKPILLESAALLVATKKIDANCITPVYHVIIPHKTQCKVIVITMRIHTHTHTHTYNMYKIEHMDVRIKGLSQ